MQVATEHEFLNPLSGQMVTLVIGSDRESTGVRHFDCPTLADVSPELDSAFCSKCHWQCRISGAWFMDLYRGRPAAMDEGRYECRNCGAVVTAGDLIGASLRGRLSPGRYHPYAEDPTLPCGPVACDECGGIEFEPWREDPRYPECIGCHHVCAHVVGEVDA